ncbi:hypothetical protein N431DRAFT_437245 [Stipitochalara longipes BDJ]|nr:hypothetical protein N431DRAFT_437245 [Stipitochalara longipes BDJ]
MTEAKNTGMMDTEPGGENTQYESANTFTKPHAKSQGQFSDPNPNEAKQQLEQQKRERGEQTAENIRYGETISEHGFGGETVGNSGEANQGAGFGREVEDGDGNADGNGQMRREQGYGGGSEVGG